MDKNFLKDTIPSTHNHKKSIRNIPLSENATRKVERANESASNRISPKRTIKRNRKMSYGTPWKKIMLSVAIIAIIGYFGFSFMNAKTTLTLTPQTSLRSIDLAYVIYNSEVGAPEDGLPSASEESEDGESPEENSVTLDTTQISIPFTTKDISVTQSKNIPASGEESVEDKAIGTITIYNEYSEDPQQLITNTRFESPDGKVYRIQKAIIIPGMTKGSNGATVPGTITAEVIADQAGQNSNQDQAGISFTVPGLQNTPQYETTYAKSTTPITGGFSGVRKVVSAQDEEDTREELRTDLERSIAAAVTAEANNDIFVTYNPEFITYSSLNDTVEGDSVIISEKATVSGIIFEMKTLNNAIASDALGNGSDENLVLENISELRINLEDASNFNPDSGQSGVVRFSGDARFVGDINFDQVKGDVMGMSKSELKSFLEKADGVKRARIAISPFWKQSVSENTEKIDIIIIPDSSEEI